MELACHIQQKSRTIYYLRVAVQDVVPGFVHVKAVEIDFCIRIFLAKNRFHLKNPYILDQRSGFRVAILRSGFRGKVTHLFYTFEDQNKRRHFYKKKESSNL